MEGDEFDNNSPQPSPGRPLGLLAEARNILVETIDAGPLQTRAALDEAAIQDFAERMEAGDSFPPLLCFRVEGRDRLLLAGGHHRLRAAKLAGLDTVLCRIREGSELEAFCESAADNAGHQAIRRTNQDKRACVETAIQRWPDMTFTDRELAKKLAVSHTRVSRIRAKYKASVNVATSGDADVRSDDARAPAVPRESYRSPAQDVTKPVQVGKKSELFDAETADVHPSTNGQVPITTSEQPADAMQPPSTTSESSNAFSATPEATEAVEGEATEAESQPTDTVSVDELDRVTPARAVPIAKVNERADELCRRAVAHEQFMAQQPLQVRVAAEQAKAIRMVVQILKKELEAFVAV